MLEREEWSNKACFPDGEYKIVEDVVTRLHVAVAKILIIYSLFLFEKSRDHQI